MANNYTITRKSFISGSSRENKFDFDSDIANSIREMVHLSKLEYDRSKKSDEELAKEYSAEEIEMIKSERLRKAISGVFHNIEKCVKSSDNFNYFFTFTTKNKTLNSHPMMLLDAVYRYIRKQNKNINFIIVLEKFENGNEYHIHGISNKKINFFEWIRNFEGDTNNLYCKPIYTNKEVCFLYLVNHLENTYKAVRNLYDEESFPMIKVYRSHCTHVECGSYVASNIKGNTSVLHVNAIHNLIKEREKFGFNYELYLNYLIKQFIPLHNNVLRGKAIKNKWNYLDKGQKDVYNFILAEFTNIAEKFVNNQNYFFNKVEELLFTWNLYYTDTYTDDYKYYYLDEYCKPVYINNKYEPGTPKNKKHILRNYDYKKVKKFCKEHEFIKNPVFDIRTMMFIFEDALHTAEERINDRKAAEKSIKINKIQNDFKAFKNNLKNKIKNIKIYKLNKISLKKLKEKAKIKIVFCADKIKNNFLDSVRKNI